MFPEACIWWRKKKQANEHHKWSICTSPGDALKFKLKVGFGGNELMPTSFKTGFGRLAKF